MGPSSKSKRIGSQLWSRQAELNELVPRPGARCVRPRCFLYVQGSFLHVQEVGILDGPPQQCRLWKTLEIIFLELGSIFCIRKGQQIIVGCSPRAQLNVDVCSKSLDAQGFPIRSGLRGDPIYSSWVEAKTRQMCRVLQCFCDTWRILFEYIQILKYVKTLVFYSVSGLRRSVVT